MTWSSPFGEPVVSLDSPGRLLAVDSDLENIPTTASPESWRSPSSEVSLASPDEYISSILLQAQQMTWASYDGVYGEVATTKLTYSLQDSLAGQTDSRAHFDEVVGANRVNYNLSPDETKRETTPDPKHLKEIAESFLSSNSPGAADAEGSDASADPVHVEVHKNRTARHQTRRGKLRVRHLRCTKPSQPASSRVPPGPSRKRRAERQGALDEVRDEVARPSFAAVSAMDHGSATASYRQVLIGSAVDAREPSSKKRRVERESDCDREASLPSVAVSGMDDGCLPSSPPPSSVFSPAAKKYNLRQAAIFRTLRELREGQLLLHLEFLETQAENKLFRIEFDPLSIAKAIDELNNCVTSCKSKDSGVPGICRHNLREFFRYSGIFPTEMRGKHYNWEGSLVWALQSGPALSQCVASTHVAIE